MFKLILLCIVVCVLNKTSVKCRTDLTSLTCNEEFETYKKINNKSYYRVYDKLRSLEAFNENCKLVNDHNKLYKYGDRNFTLGTNALADLNTDAYLKRYLRLIRSQRNTSTEDMKEVVGMSHLENVPDSFDWRKKGFTTLAHNQQNCGSCYAFSIAESIEGQIFKRTGKLLSLSVQQIVDCSISFGNQGCTGGSLRNTLRYLQATGGLMRSSDYKYVSKKEKCQFVGDLAVTNVSSWAILPAHNENAIEAAVAHIGPVAVSINAAPKTFQLYSHGIYDDLSCSSASVNHAMLIVGYGKDFWILKNWWGEIWGESGYMRIRKGINLCAISNYAAYAICWCLDYIK
ncbi:procathepsin L isoform X3 [Drosophila willistoni]|uniref:procathepsin L isoform X3 n=1 Tax=Drosophila willistoni TaxID=7260 RepID=UPI001F0816EE|nr:procathepsin L isoform X3 [Drosophila willistoni]